MPAMTRAAAFTAETGIKTYKWNVADYDASVAGIAKVEADLGPIEVVVANAGITRDAHVPQDDAGAVERGHRHQPHRRVQHHPPGLAVACASASLAASS
jgi:NAD(P)-dependent dehydrogenase (short-subunit alcohol dehydrogenase family)